METSRKKASRISKHADLQGSPGAVSVQWQPPPGGARRYALQRARGAAEQRLLTPGCRGNGCSDPRRRWGPLPLRIGGVGGTGAGERAGRACGGRVGWRCGERGPAAVCGVREWNCSCELRLFLLLRSACCCSGWSLCALWIHRRLSG